MKTCAIAAVATCTSSCVSAFGLSMSNNGDIVPSSSRRSFFGKAMISTGLVSSSATLGLLLDIKDNDHVSDCNCGNCLDRAAAIMNNGLGQHPSGCNCGPCVRFGPSPAMAYEKADDIDTNRSPDYYAQMLQVWK